MASKEIESKLKELRVNVAETRDRIRRYALDPRLRFSSARKQLTEKRRTAQPAGAGESTRTTVGPPEGITVNPVPSDHRLPSPDAAPSDPAQLSNPTVLAIASDPSEQLRDMTTLAWNEWLLVRDALTKLPAELSSGQLDEVERMWLVLDWKVDLIQRELIAENSFRSGFVTVIWMSFTLIVLFIAYLWSHGVRGLNLISFEPWPEWGPLKYAEVASWSLFGVLCWLLFLASRYLSRRDFDHWYQPWYLSSALRAPFLTVILMMVVLEFSEWYGEETWIQRYLLEEGNKFYFIVFMSFSLGLTSDRTSRIAGDLTEGVGEFVHNAVRKVSHKLASVFEKNV
jgi:hypothetical protein